MVIPKQPAPSGQQPQQSQQSSALLTELQSEVSVEAAPLLQYIVKHVRVIVTGLILFICVLAGTAGYNWYTGRAATKAQMELAALTLTAQGAERLMALETFAATAPVSIRMAAWLAVADAAVQQQDFVKAAHAFGQVVAFDTQGVVGSMAALNEGQALLRAGQAAKALTVLETLEARIQENQRPMVQQILAEAALHAGNVPRARKAFEALEQKSAGNEVEYYRFRLRMLPAEK